MAATFTTKVNKRASGQELSIIDEAHTVPLVSPFQIKLVEVPLEVFPSTVSIPGFTETTNVTPSTGEFSVSYSTGFVTFNSSAAGTGVLVSYEGTGSVVDANDINAIQTELFGISTEVETARGNKSSLDERLDITLDDDGLLQAGVVTPSTISTVLTDDFIFPNDVEVTAELRVLGSFVGPVVSSDPVSPQAGQTWFNSTDNQFKGYNGTEVVILG